MLGLEVVVTEDNYASKLKGLSAGNEIHQGTPEAARTRAMCTQMWVIPLKYSFPAPHVLPFMLHTGSNILRDTFQITASKPGEFSQNQEASLGNALALAGSFYVATSFFLPVRKHGWGFHSSETDRNPPDEFASFPS